MNINTSNSLANTGATSQVNKIVQQPIHTEVPADAPKQLPLTDRVELSGMSALLSSLKAGKDLRADKVASVRAQIEAGTYETEEKLDVAADKLLDDLLK